MTHDGTRGVSMTDTTPPEIIESLHEALTHSDVATVRYLNPSSSDHTRELARSNESTGCPGHHVGP